MPRQGVEAQTLANVYQAIDNNHEIVPVLNKIDLPAAEPERVKQQIEDVIGLDAANAIPISAKTGKGVGDVLEAIVTRLPPPRGDPDAPLKALLVDSWYDAYLGVIVLVRIVDGVLKKGMRVRMMGTGATHDVDTVGVFTPKLVDWPELGPGELGFLTGSIKAVADTRVGDTITDDRRPAAKALPGFRPAQPVVFCGIFPVDAADFENLRAAIGKLRLNDAAFTYEPETSAALGFGFRCGFLGLLHLEIVQERLTREFDLDLIATAPSVVYRIRLTDGTEMELHNPADMPDPVRIAEIAEPWLRATILTPDDYLGPILKLCQERRGVQVDLSYVGNRAMVQVRPAAERGRLRLLRPAEVAVEGLRLVRLSPDRLPAGRPRQDARSWSTASRSTPCPSSSTAPPPTGAAAPWCEKLKELIPPHMFQIPIQAAIGGRIIARETVRALRKDVLAKCYGGDVTRKRKLLEKQKAGKKRMRQFGKVDIPQEAFIAALKMEE